jgi:hypothetical protein
MEVVVTTIAAELGELRNRGYRIGRTPILTGSISVAA